MINLGRLARLCLGVALLAARPALSDPAASALLKKAGDAISSAKTYQAVYEMQMGAAGMGAGMKMTVEVKALPGRKGWSRTNPIGMTLFDDGKSMVLYSSMANRYQRAPSSQGKATLQWINMARADASSNNRILRKETVAGRACTVVELTPKQAKKGASVDRMLIYIDNATSRICRLQGAGSQMGPQGKPVAFSMEMRVTSEKLNAPIPDSVFTFVPPKGAQEGMASGPPPGVGAGSPKR